MLKQNLWRKLSQCIHRNKKVSIIVSIALIIVGGAGVAAAYIYSKNNQPEPGQATSTKKNTPNQSQTAYYSPLTGVKVADQAATTSQVTAIIIENNPESRPQSGLKQSGIVYEAVAEAGITRFLVLYQEDKPNLVGPVRSLRPYYIDWLAPFDASVAHVGGSANALTEIRNGNYKDIDQFFNANTYWRATDRYAPHNVYTNFERIDALNQQKGFTSSQFTGFMRKLDSPSPAPNAATIQVGTSNPTYNSSYAYDAASNSYLRYSAGVPHVDREAGQINPKSVVVMHVPTHIGFEDGYREQMTTTGHNKAYFFQDGTVTEGFWRKQDRSSQIQFYDTLGRPIALNAGQTWINVISPERPLTWE